jgi:hypothetical protein
MNTTQASSLIVAILSFLAAAVLSIFAATDSKSASVFSILAAFFALSGVFWVYWFAKGRKAL